MLRTGFHQSAKEAGKGTRCSLQGALDTAAVLRGFLNSSSLIASRLLIPVFFAVAWVPVMVAAEGAGSGAGSGTAATPYRIVLGINQSTIVENAVGIKRVSIANPELAEAVAVNRNELLLNGRVRGATSMVVWDMKGQRSQYAIEVTGGLSKADFVREQLKSELPGQNVSFDLSEGSVFLKGTVSDVVAADRAAAITATLGKVINLLKVKVPDAEPQIMLKVRFANVSRASSLQLGFNLFSTGATNTPGNITTGQFPAVSSVLSPPNGPTTATVSDMLNVFLFRRDLNLGAAIQLLQAKQLLEILAEPNLLTVSGRPASFLAGGEFPFPTLQGGGSGVGQITVQFREFGIRIKFLPTVTPRGTIRLAVTPEVSSLDYSSALTVSGVTVPGLSTRRVQTEVELESGQSFVIAGLLDNRTTEILNKIPGLSNIPLLGKLFESKSLQKNNSELMVLVTPELVNPVTATDAKPEIKMTVPFMKEGPGQVPQNPRSPKSKLPSVESLPVEVIKSWSEPDPASSGAPPVPPNQNFGPGANGSGAPAFSSKANQ